MTAGNAALDPILARTVATHRRRVARANRNVLIAQLAILAIFLIAWEVASGHGLDPYFFSKPSAIWHAVVNLVLGGKLALNLAISAQEVAIGYVAGSAVAIAAAIALGLSRRAAEIVEPLLLVVYSIPTIALAPLIIVWFGTGIDSKIMISGFFVFFVVFFNTVSGVRDVPAGWIACSRIMGASRWQLIARVIVPAARPHIVTGLKVGLPQAVVGAIVGEFMSAQRGVGYLIVDASSRYDTAGVFAAMAVTSLLVLILAALPNVLAAARRRGRARA
jgi:NitT/TauT family transport system permease protein